jgi:hypothetical protein
MKASTHASWFLWTRGLAALGLLLFWICLTIFQRPYITRRYEQETSLSKLRFFSTPVIGYFKPSLQRSIKNTLYTGHIFFAWALPTRWLKGLSSFSDISDRREILRHFSRAEIATAVVTMTLGLAAIAAGAVTLVLSPFV